ncbi:Hypothetical predicted protein [Marmota monax]|uniref:Uncharacterized protein n=1 Tax=Marmota monax TaxID=9995 RepID=A0A5E4A5B4_MARMO|nr:Hypothetical predicted protein [Marmota monax]
MFHSDTLSVILGHRQYKKNFEATWAEESAGGTPTKRPVPCTRTPVTQTLSPTKPYETVVGAFTLYCLLVSSSDTLSRLPYNTRPFPLIETTSDKTACQTGRRSSSVESYLNAFPFGDDDSTVYRFRQILRGTRRNGRGPRCPQNPQEACRVSRLKVPRGEHRVVGVLSCPWVETSGSTRDRPRSTWESWLRPRPTRTLKKHFFCVTSSSHNLRDSSRCSSGWSLRWYRVVPESLVLRGTHYTKGFPSTFSEIFLRINQHRQMYHVS